MSKPRYRWWGYVKAVIRAYPALDKVMREPNYTPTTARRRWSVAGMCGNQEAGQAGHRGV